MTDSSNASAPPAGAGSIPTPNRTSAPVSVAPRGAFPMHEDMRTVAVSLVAELAETVGAEDERSERAILLHEVAEIEERVRGDELAAAKSYLGAFNARPVFRPPLGGLIRLYTRRKSVKNLEKLLEALIKAAPSEREKADAIVERGELLEDREGNTAAGRGAYEEAVLVDPTSRSAWLALERSGLKENDPALLRRALLKLAELTQDPTRKARLLTECAWELARAEAPESILEASKLFREAAALPLGRWRALVELERFAERTHRPDDLVFALEGRASLAQDVASGQGFQGGSGSFAIARLQDAEEARQTAADLWARAARVRLSRLNDADGALSAMDQALALKPEDTRFRVYAMQLADQAGETTRAAQHAGWLLEKEYGDGSIRGALHFRIAEAAAAGGDMQAAGDALRSALAANPESAATLGAMIDQMIASGDGTGATEQFDRLAVAEENKTRRAALYRTAAMLSLAISSDVESAVRRFRLAAEEDPQDAVSRRALVTLWSRTVKGEDARPLATAIDELLAFVQDGDEREALLLKKLQVQRFDLNDLDGAAATAEALAKATDGDRAALEAALMLRSATQKHGAAAKLAEQLSEKSDADSRSAWLATAVRLHWAAGDEAAARTMALALHKEEPGDPYLATLAFRLALAANDPTAALDVLIRKADAAGGEASTRWLLIGSVLLAQAGAKTESRKALEHAAERTPESAAVRAALLSSTRWRPDLALRSKLADAAINAEDASDEEAALGVEYVLARVFLEHDIPAAMVALDRVVERFGGESLAVSILNAIVVGSQRGPDAEETVSALQGVLSAVPPNDPVRVAIELEVARALSGSTATRDQGREVRQLLDEEHPHSVAPRLLALLDAIQREERQEVPTALCKVADSADESTGAVLRSVALAALRAQGRDDEARVLAMTYPELPASAITLSEISGGLDHASARANGYFERAALTVPAHKAGAQRRAAVWSSLAGRDDEAITAVEALIKNDAGDVVAWDILRVAGRRRAKWSRVVEACAAVAERIKDRSRASALWEEAGVVYLDQLGSAPKAEAALRKALENDPRRMLAYRRLREILERRKDHAGLEAVVSTRVAATQEPEELVELLWEQARLRRALGRREDALESAKNVVLLDSDHVAAWAMCAEVHASSGRLADAAEALAFLARAKGCPPAQRKVARQGAIDIFDVRLKQPARALEQLDALVEEGDADEKSIERGVEIAARAELWDGMLRFAKLSAERARNAFGRSNALLRVAEIFRDRLADPESALKAAQTAHDAMPSRLEALRVVHGLADEDEKIRRARRTVDAIRESMRLEGPSADHAVSIDQAARLATDTALARAAQRLAKTLGAQGISPVAVGMPTGKTSLRDPGLALRYRDPDDAGAAVLLLETVLPDMSELVGLSTDAFGVGRGERVKASTPVRDAAAVLAASAGVAQFELYVGGNDDQRIAVIPGDPIAIVLGRRIAAPFDETVRYRLLRSLLLAARGIAALQLTTAADAADLVLAALAAAELTLTGGTMRIEARLRPVAKALTRKVRKGIAESGRQLAGAPDPQGELIRGARAALSTVRRGTLAVSGATTAAFEELRSADPSPASKRDLCLFAISDALVGIERETGVDRG